VADRFIIPKTRTELPATKLYRRQSKCQRDADMVCPDYAAAIIEPYPLPEQIEKCIQQHGVNIKYTTAKKH